jgi:transcription initiation factor TFIIIB Brf1 subunit/transcription initiation factor TFIIB
MLMADGENTICFACQTVFQTESEESKQPEREAPASCCDNPHIVVDHRQGEHVCNNCGLINNSSVFDYYCFDEDGTSTHVEIGVPGDNRRVIKHLRASKWSLRALTARDKIMLKALHITSKHEISKTVVDDVLEVYDSLDHSQGMLRGKDMDVICSALIYVALQKQNNGRSMHECAKFTGVPMKKFTRILKFVGIKSKPEERVSSSVADKTSMMTQYTSALGFTPAQKRLAQHRIAVLETTPIALYTKFAIAIYSVSLQHEESNLEELESMLKVRRQTIVKNYEKFKGLMQV